MTKELIENVLVGIVVISAIAAVFLPLFFREGGIIWGATTRKAIIVSAVCFEIFMWAAVAGISIDDPSKTLSAVICMGGFSIPLGI